MPGQRSPTPQRVGWTEPDSEVAFLVLDRNENGIIDDGSELFGNATPKRDGSRAANGFEALLDLDGGPESSDGAITASDGAYTRLRLWLDRNHNGRSEPDELLTLEEAGVVAIFTDYEVGRREDRHGNRYALSGTALVEKAGQQLRRRIFDVVLSTQ